MRRLVDQVAGIVFEECYRLLICTDSERFISYGLERRMNTTLKRSIHAARDAISCFQVFQEMETFVSSDI
jgi:hypothetical protein